MSNKYIIMNEKDNCATSLRDLPQNEQIEYKGTILNLNHAIPLGHKFALNDLPVGELVYKYGQIIGITTQVIQRGDWIHTHNLKSHYLEVVSK